MENMIIATQTYGLVYGKKISPDKMLEDVFKN